MPVKKNTLIGLIVAAILAIALGLSQFFAFEQNVSNSEEHEVQNQNDVAYSDMMREHCQQMPEMKGCEEYRDSAPTENSSMPMDHMMMDHGAMVTSEEAFVVNMIPHHQEAVDTAKLVVAKGENPELKKLAQNIITAQEKEINMMNQWSQAWSFDKQKSAYENMMGDGTKLSGKDLDNWFLRGMIMHHMGAVQMARAVLKLNTRTEIADFAKQVIEVQSEEITQMKLMLGENMMPLRND